VGSLRRSSGIIVAGVFMACSIWSPIVPPAAAQTKTTRSKPKSQAAVRPKPKSIIPPSAATDPAERQLEQLTRALREDSTTRLYEQLSQFAAVHANGPLGPRAALALGYYDFSHKDFDAARKWFRKASADPILPDYVLYWQTQTDHASGVNETALDEFTKFRGQYPDSVMNDAVLQGLAEAALSVGRPEAAAAALDGYAQTTASATLIMLRAQAREKIAAAKGDKPYAATSDYLDLVYRFPLSEEARSASYKIPVLQAALGDEFPGTPLAVSIARAEAFYDARRWSDLRSAYNVLMPQLTGQARERALLRLALAESQTAPTRAIATLTALNISDPALDAERINAIAQLQATAKQETEMLTSTERLATLYPRSPWTEQALYGAGTFYWYKLDRDTASRYYQRVISEFPNGSQAGTAEWRVIWTAYLARQDDAASRMEEYVRKYPASGYTVDALYWIGRAYERSGNLPHARSFYLTAVERFPQTYFGLRAEDRLREIGREPINPSEFLSVIPPAAPLEPIGDTIPPAAEVHWQRAQALRTIAFDSSAEQELRAAYAETHAPQLLLAVAKSAVAAGHYGAGIVALRQVIPQLEARRFDEVPQDAWRTVYPLPYRDLIERESTRHMLDPMLVAGLIRQESAFASDAVSSANAVGLMQVWPPTGVRLARTLNVTFSRSRLFEPDYNVRLGALYLSDLLSMYHSPEAALAAYNAGETHVEEWNAGQNYQEIAEFVESIPFNQTRDYVQIVARNAQLYRQIYGVTSADAAEKAPAPSRP
jgi:soluble lytic murein transglycosylase